MAADDKIRARYEAFFGTDFLPLIRHEQTQGAEERIAYASEYAAFQLGKIDQKLGRLIELMERNASAEPTPPLAPLDHDTLAAREGINRQDVVGLKRPTSDQPQEGNHGQGSDEK